MADKILLSNLFTFNFHSVLLLKKQKLYKRTPTQKLVFLNLLLKYEYDQGTLVKGTKKQLPFYLENH